MHISYWLLHVDYGISRRPVLIDVKMNVIRNVLFTRKRVAVEINSYQKRYRVKQTWASSKKKKLPHELALDHFDLYYNPMFGTLWPSIRIALLSRQKYCAVVNNFTNNLQDVILELAELGASDFIHLAKNTSTSERYSLLRNASEQVTSNAKADDSKLDWGVQDSLGRNLHDFMPVNKILSEKEQMKLDEIEQNIHRPELTPVEILPAQTLRFPHALQPFTVARGDTASYSPAGKDENNKLTYYLMDASSILPVIALDLEPGCEVLDLCAAPGGKSYSILQTLLPEKVTCVDNSYSRISRLKDVMKLYLPRSYIEQKKIEIVHTNGVAFCLKAQERYDRVLVDVPCFTDRHVLHEDDNNLFRTSRISERLEIQELQQQLLFAGIKSCKPGGVIVYSTCTLSMPQNDGTVQATLEKILQETNMEVVIEDTGIIAEHFRKTFSFYGKCRYGQLVVPNLTANFGPSYFSKLRRLK